MLVGLCGFARLSLATEKPVLKTVTADTNYPYNFVKDKRIQGISIDIAEELTRRLDMRLHVDIVPWTRALQTAQMQPAIMAFSVARIPEREDNYYWIGPVSTSEEWLYKLKRRGDVQVLQLKDARRYLVGDEASNASIPSFLKLGIKVDTAPSMLSNCKKFKLGRVDLIPFDPDGIANFLNECDLTLDEVEKTVRLPRNTALYFVFGKSTSPEFIQKIEKAFSSMQQDKTLNKINAKWKTGTGNK